MDLRNSYIGADQIIEAAELTASFKMDSGETISDQKKTIYYISDMADKNANDATWTFAPTISSGERIMTVYNRSNLKMKVVPADGRFEVIEQASNANKNITKILYKAAPSSTAEGKADRAFLQIADNSDGVFKVGDPKITLEGTTTKRERINLNVTEFTKVLETVYQNAQRTYGTNPMGNALFIAHDASTIEYGKLLPRLTPFYYPGSHVLRRGKDITAAELAEYNRLTAEMNQPRYKFASAPDSVATRKAHAEYVMFKLVREAYKKDKNANVSSAIETLIAGVMKTAKDLLEPFSSANEIEIVRGGKPADNQSELTFKYTELKFNASGTLLPAGADAYHDSTDVSKLYAKKENMTPAQLAYQSAINANFIQDNRSGNFYFLTALTAGFTIPGKDVENFMQKSWGAIFAHEFSHTIGLFDEYRPNGRPVYGATYMAAVDASNAIKRAPTASGYDGQGYARMFGMKSPGRDIVLHDRMLRDIRQFLEEQNYLTENKIELAKKNRVQVAQLGPNQAGASLPLSDAVGLLNVAKEIWIAAGVDPQAIQLASVKVGKLPPGVAALSSGDQIMVSDNACGWGWFVDKRPMDQVEFADNSGVQSASSDEQSRGKLDLLTVLLHELGHVAGLVHSEGPDQLMSAVIEPGVRKLPSIELLGRVNEASQAVIMSNNSPAIATALIAGPTRYVQGVGAGDGWSTHGDVSFDQEGRFTLKEANATHTEISKNILIDKGARFLSFTTGDISLNAIENNAGDAFEVAMLDSATGVAIGATDGLRNFSS